MKNLRALERTIENCFWAERAMPSGGPAWLGAWSTGWRCLRRRPTGFVLADVCTRCPFWEARTSQGDENPAAPLDEHSCAPMPDVIRLVR